jgi:FecR-like protein
MKRIQFFVSMVICVVVLALTATASAQSVQQGVVTVVRIQGVARYSSSDNVWHSLTPGTTLGAGDVIQSGADSTVDLILSDKAVRVGFQPGVGSPIGSVINIAGLPKYNTGHQQATPEQNVIRLQADTVLAVDKFTFSQTGADTVSDTELDLRAGKIFGNVKKISAASQYLVKMPTGVAGIRGTIFALGADGSVTVLQGSVVISSIGINGRVFTTVLAAGDEFDPQTDQVTRLRPNELVDAILNARAIIIAIHSVVTVTETPTATGQDTTTIYISPTSGRR